MIEKEKQKPAKPKRRKSRKALPEPEAPAPTIGTLASFVPYQHPLLAALASYDPETGEPATIH